MLRLRGHGTQASDRGEPPRGARATAISIVVHALLAVGLWNVLQFPRAITFLMGETRSAPPVERLRYLTVAPRRDQVALAVPSARLAPESSRRPTVEPAPPRSQPPVTVAAPAEVPSAIPPASTAPRVLGPTSGPLITGQGPVRGVQPGYTEPRIWVESPAVTAAPLVGDAKLDSAVSALILAYRDSVAENTYQPNKFERGDWTYTTKDGKKYGVDQQFIRLGKVSIPTALLGLLPMNQQGNPIAYDRQRRLDAMRVEIIAQAQQAMNEEEFRRAVRQIRERKERERKEAEKKKKTEVKVISDP
ncbi:MAG: hypothetical protein IT361_13070 [Gemmatimonadaceae bacterium]|nr:hypothetical protein [Gemmatimonadaceae bacterium]